MASLEIERLHDVASLEVFVLVLHHLNHIVYFFF